MPAALTAKTFGMPRWAWLILLAGGIGFGIALRRNREEQIEADEMLDDEAEVMLETGDPLDAGIYEDPGLAGVGVYGQSPASVVPVQAPVIPEGFVDQGAVLGDVLSTFITEWGRPPATNQGTGNRPPKPTVTPKGKAWVWNGRQWILVAKPGRGGGNQGGGNQGGGSGNGGGSGGRTPAVTVNDPIRGPRRNRQRQRPLTGGGPPTVAVTAHRPVQRRAPIRAPQRPAPRRRRR